MVCLPKLLYPGCIYTLLLSLFFSVPCFSQKPIFFDDFNDNRNGWKQYRGEHSLVEVKNGVLHLQKFEKNFTDRGCLWYNKPIPGFNAAEDFSITFYAKYVSGGDIFDEIDFQWGETTNRSEKGNILGGLYQLQILFRGEVHLNYFASKWTYFIRKDVDQLSSNSFNPHKFNRYDLIQQDSFIIVKVNNIEILRQLYTPIPGDGIGIQGCLKSAWEMDKITIKQKKNRDPLVIVPTLPLTKMDVIPPSSSTDLKVSPNPFDKLFKVGFFLDKEEKVQLSLVDMNGIIIQQHSKTFPAGTNYMDMYADVPAGSYILKVQYGSKVLTAKLIKR